MNNSVKLARLAASAALLLAALGACGDDDVDIVDPEVTGGELFRTYVALGNSITAGYQSGGINDSTQRQSYAYLLAEQLYGADLSSRWFYPALAGLGCPPPVNNFQTQTRVGSGTSTTCQLRASASAQPVLNNVAVPGATVLDPTRVQTAFSNTLTTLILGGRSQVSRALEARPTFVTAWIGNNDVLAAAVSGILTPLAVGTGSSAVVVSPGLTVDTIFRQNYQRMVDSLLLAPTLRGGALIGVVQVAAAPILFPVAALSNPAFKAGFDQFTGGSTTIDASCLSAPGNQALISFQIVGAIRTYRATPTAASAHPPIIACAAGAVAGAPALVGNIYVLDATEQATLASRITGWNTFISEQATAHDWAYVDPNPILTQLKSGASPCVTTVPNLASATDPFGTCVSLDGVHPRRPAHVAVANALIAAIKAKYPEASGLGTVQ